MPDKQNSTHVAEHSGATDNDRHNEGSRARMWRNVPCRSVPRVSSRFMANGHTHYCGPGRGPHVEN